MLRFLTAGESHGPALAGILDGLPPGIAIDVSEINGQLARRQRVPGRGGRMLIEHDEVEILSGLRQGKTLGSPLCLVIRNRDHENWQHVYGPGGSAEPVRRPRPGHADYPGMVKFGFDDARNVIERASARETAMRTALGTAARQCLAGIGVRIYSRVLSLGPLTLCDLPETEDVWRQGQDKVLGFPEATLMHQAEELLGQAKAAGHSVGGTLGVVAFGLPVGIGSYTQADLRLDARLAADMASIPAVRAVEFGRALALAESAPGVPGDSLVVQDGKLSYRGNNNAGLAGGMSTGQPLIVRCAVKPIPTAMPGLTVDLASGEAVSAVKERSDTTAVPAAAVVAEAVLALGLLREIIDSLGTGYFR
ncbi:MAG TPA: chorismate synthase [Bacillota bacterium]|nr:chorismate synthase [Bacillota bacterium]